MTGNRPDIEAIFFAACHMEPENRAAYLDEVCGGDAELRQRVEQFLSAQAELGSFLEPRAAPLVGTVDEPVTESPGTVIGAYKLLEPIGEGGFGVVFMAEQQRPVRRKVALKILKPGMDTRQVVARFEAERQALALMDHPSIAKVLDGGQTDSGRPYFVMDLVKGLPITDYCDQAQLTLRERLELFGHLCQAVQHAHQKGIIHRDLKPTNVLVTLHEGTPLVKVIDFGIAKALGQQLTDKTLFTGFAQMIGTPLYMAPEQAALSNVDVDTRSDVYSLGVLLYELLTGTTPFDKDRIKELSFDELRRIIREEEPPRPSTRISTLGKAATTLSTQRKSDPRRLSQLCRGELDWIVMKALEKDRNRRYESASALAADVQRYLHDEPVQACPPSAWYRFRKFTRRKKTGLVVAACVFLALAGIAVGIGWAVRDHAAREEEIERDRLAREEQIERDRLAREEQIERDRLAREAALDQAVAQTLEATGPLMEKEKWPEALAAVERADQLLAAAGRTERPSRLLELRKDLAMAERLEGIDAQPKKYLEAGAIDSIDHETKKTFPTYAPWAVEMLLEERKVDAAFARAFREFGIDVDALAPAEAAARIARSSIHAVLIKALDEWGPRRREEASLRGATNPDWTKLIEIARLADPDPWRNRCREAVLRRDRQALEQLADTVPIPQVSPRTLWLLGVTLNEVGGLDKAVTLLKRAQHQYPTDLWINERLGIFSLYRGARRYDDAVRFYSIAVALRPQRAKLHHDLYLVLMEKGAYEDAVAESSRAIELDPNNATWWYARGNVYGSRLNQYDKAVADFTKVIELDRKFTSAWSERGSAYSGLGQYDKALADFNEAIRLDPKKAHFYVGRGWTYEKLKQYDNAIADYTEALKLDPKNRGALVSRGDLYRSLHQYEKALADYSTYTALKPNEGGTHIGHPGWVWKIRGDVYTRLRQYDKALADYSKAVELDPKNDKAWAAQGDAYTQLKQYDKAIAVLNKAMERYGMESLAIWINRGNAYFGLKQYDKALADYTTAVELAPKFALPFSNRGDAYTQLKQYDKAFADLNRAIELDPKFARAWSNRGNAYLSLEQYDKAIADCTRAIELDPEHFNTWNSRGLAYSALKQCDKAINDFTRAIELDPKFAVIWSNRGLAYYRLKQYDKALADCTRAIDLDPKDALNWSSRSLAYRELRQYDKAIADYTRAIELDPKNAVFWNNRGSAYSELKQYDKAVADCTRAIELDPKNAVAWNNRGNAYYGLKQYDKALADLTETLKLNPNLAVVWIHRGNAYSGLRQYDKAIADYTRAIELDPKFAVAWSYRGWAFANLRQWDKALADFSRAIEINPDAPRPWCYRALVHLQRDDRAGYRKGCADMRQHFSKSADADSVHWTVWTCIQLPDGVDDWTKLVEWAEKALAADPSNDAWLTTLGAALYRAGRFDEAVRRLTEAEAAFKKAKASPSTITYTWLFLAMAEERRGHPEQARKWLAGAVREIEQPPAERANDPGVGSWNRRLTLLLLRGEAEALLKIDKKPENKEP
jgi:tetratricopeptide (TPR) repeat protein